MPETPLIQRLKERKLVQWALAYLAGAWVVLQALDPVSQAWGISPSIQRAIQVLLIVGLILTLVLAWYHGEKGRQRVSGPELLMVAALLVIAGGVLTMLGSGEEGEPSPPMGLEDDRPSIAVLPFDNFSPNPNDAYFADGMQEQLVLTLSKIRSLSVKGRTSAMRYRGDPKPLPQIAEELGVTFLMEGSARIAGGRVSVTAQLIDGVRDEHLWAEEYDREFSVDDIVSIHREIAGQVASQLRTVLTLEEQQQVSATPTGNTEALEYYLRGREASRRRSPGDLRAAIGYFTAAIEKDEAFAQAHAGLADALILLGWGVQDTTMFRRAGEAAERAVLNDSLLAEAHTSRAYARFLADWDWDGAEDSFKRAIDLDPDYGTAHQWYGEFLGAVGRFEEGILETGLAVQMDPLSPGANLDHGEAFLYAGRVREATEILERARDLAPAYWGPYPSLIVSYALGGREDDALWSLEAFVRLIMPPQDLQRWEEVWEVADFQAALESTLEGLEMMAGAGTRIPGGYGSLARLYLLRGQPEEAMRRLEMAFRAREASFISLMGDPTYDPLRDDSRFQAILSQMGLTQ